MLTDQEAGFRRILSSYKARAKRRGLEWALSDSDLKLLLASACWYCGCSPQRVYNRSGPTTDSGYPDLFHANGIDRIDNSKGYLPTNVRPACALCNFAKRDMDEWAYYRWLTTTYEHLKAKQIL